MELFRYRNLTLASFSFLLCLFVSYYVNNITRIAALVVSGVAFLVVLFLCIFKSSQGILDFSFHIIPSLIFIMIAIALSLIFFDKSSIYELCDEDEHKIVATVTEVKSQTAYMGTYEIILNEVDGEEFKEKVFMTMNSEPLERGDTFESDGAFIKLSHTDMGFDEADYLLSHGIFVSFVSDEFDFIENEKMPLLDILDGINSFLDRRMATVGDETAHSLMSAMFLGNKSHLSQSLQRDFRRLGLSHILALSGMHITIVVTLLGFAIQPLSISRTKKELLLILATLFFVAMTGFSNSALRAGLMVSLTYSLFFLGNRTSLTTSLFYSVCLICIINPYSLFSVSLQLSFFAMLGCIFSSKATRRIKFLNNVWLSPVRFAFFTFVSSVFVSLFTLPIISISFGSFSILSPLTNIFLTPLFSVLIYLSPFYLLVADIPFVSDGLGWFCTQISSLSTTVGQKLSSLEGIIVPIINIVQVSAIVVISIFLFKMLVTRKKHFLRACLGCAFGALIFICGTIYLLFDREANVYAGAYSFNKNDIVFIEDENEITIIDVTKGNAASYQYSTNVASHLGYYEIENYVITGYSTTTHIAIKNLCDHTIVKNVFLPSPRNQKEIDSFYQICEICRNMNVATHSFDTRIDTQNTSIVFSSYMTLPRSSQRVVAFYVDLENARFTYLGASAYERFDYFAPDSVYESDIVVFGSFGPAYKVKYDYTAPYLDHCLFLGNSQDFAQDEFIKRHEKNTSKASRFLLTP